jgi:hypothetical protein
MKIFLYSISILYLAACSSSKVSKGSEHKESVVVGDTADFKIDPKNPMANDINVFFKRFEAAVLSHNPQRIIQFMDKDYKVAQHDTYFKNNTSDFLNLFFSGNDAQSHIPVKVDFTKIVQIHKMDIKMINGFYNAYYTLVSEGKTIETSWVLMVKLDGSNVNFGLYGPVSS